MNFDITYIDPSHDTKWVTTTRNDDGTITFKDNKTGDERRYVEQSATFDYVAWARRMDERPKPLRLHEYDNVISDSELDALQDSWGFDPEPEPDEMEYASFVVNTCQGLSQNKAAERLAKEFGGTKGKYRQMFQRKQLPIAKSGSAWSFTDEYKWKICEL